MAMVKETIGKELAAKQADARQGGDDPKLRREDHARCPLRDLLTRLGDKWSVLVIVTLAEAEGSRLRFSELRRAIQGISQRMLTTTLRNLERDGILKRHLFAEIPPRVEYELTALGKSILVPMQSLVAWVERSWSDIQQARETYDRREK